MTGRKRVLSWSPGKYQRRQIEGRKYEFVEASDIAQSKKRNERTVYILIDRDVKAARVAEGNPSTSPQQKSGLLRNSNK